jgi:hypothetical protein
MRNTSWLPAAGMVALGFMATSAGAAPLGGVGSFSTAVSESSEVQSVHWRRRCWRHYGHWHCRRRHMYPYYYGSPFYGPRFGIFIGPRHHHRRHWRW